MSFRFQSSRTWSTEEPREERQKEEDHINEKNKVNTALVTTFESL